MAGWVKAVLFLLGGVAAATGTAYVTGLLDPWLAPRPAVVAPAPETPAPGTPAPETPATQDEPAAAGDEAQPEAEAEVAADEPATTPKQDRLTPPVFDLLRVEPDGSVLVAGKAGPEATVEVLSGETVLGKASAGASGDFVVVLDDPLAPGDYRMALRATGPDDETVLSAGTAIVSIPETEDGQVLAMVEEPGAPAQLITVPQPSAPAEAAPDETAAEEQVAEQRPAPQTGEDEAAPETAQADEEQAGDEAPAVAEAEDGTAEAAADAASDPAQDEQAVPPAAVAEVPAEEDEQAAPAAEPAATHTVAVEAVEIEGDTIFVAGRADPGRTVRVYAGTVLLGDAVVSDGGRFLVEAKRHLEVGTYLIRADLLGADGSVVARAAVPFEREPGESIAAVAPVQEEPAPAGEEDAAASARPDEQADADATPAETAAGEAEGTTGPEAEVAVAPAAPEAGDEEATAPPLQRVDGAVIIRRGNSLWRISRRVYGHGIRYSTIYLANQDQIRDPNRIWPGQVFTLPSETPEGEQADLDAIGEQAVRPEEREAVQE